MKYFISTSLIIILCAACETRMKVSDSKTELSAIEGTWHLQSGRTITGKDTVFVDYTQGQKMIKIVNSTHFAFLHLPADAVRETGRGAGVSAARRDK